MSNNRSNKFSYVLGDAIIRRIPADSAGIRRNVHHSSGVLSCTTMPDLLQLGERKQTHAGSKSAQPIRQAQTATAAVQHLSQLLTPYVKTLNRRPELSCSAARIGRS